MNKKKDLMCVIIDLAHLILENSLCGVSLSWHSIFTKRTT